jgi:hypothetical protein
MEDPSPLGCLNSFLYFNILLLFWRRTTATNQNQRIMWLVISGHRVRLNPDFAMSGVFCGVLATRQ